MFFEFFLWWYGKGWLEVWKNSLKRVSSVQKTFSIPVLLQTLFAPWKRIITPPGRSMDEKFRGLIDNLTSRVVGFFVRLGALLISLFLTVLSLILGIAVTISWPFIPLITLYLFYRSISG